jgi:predicted HTH transcriptional regulator
MISLFEMIDNSEHGARVITKDAWAESLNLEFKTLTDRGGTTLNREDRKVIAKALCGLCNADGGFLIIGVDTEKRDGLDVATGYSLIDEPHRLAALLTAALPDLLQPRSAPIEVRTYEVEDQRGIVALRVKPSNDRPFMSVPATQFFRERLIAPVSWIEVRFETSFSFHEMHHSRLKLGC